MCALFLLGNLGCLVADKRRILEFEDDINVISSNECTPGSFFELRRDGMIQNLHGKMITIQGERSIPAKCLGTLSGLES